MASFLVTHALISISETMMYFLMSVLSVVYFLASLEIFGRKRTLTKNPIERLTMSKSMT